MGRILWTTLGLSVVLSLSAYSPASAAADRDTGDQQTTFQMKEVSVFDAQDKEPVEHGGI